MFFKLQRQENHCQEFYEKKIVSYFLTKTKTTINFLK